MSANCEGRQINVVDKVALKAPRTGFTLVELLVVIAIIGILIGLLVPAVQSAVESGRRTSCINNLKQIGLATTQYETSQRQYPINWGVVGSVGVPTNGAIPSLALSSSGTSWLTLILPYMDSRTLFDQIAVGQSMGYTGNVNGISYNNPTASQTLVKTFICPSDPHPTQFNGYGPTNYKACAGMNWTGFQPFAASSGTRGRNSSPGNPTPTNGLDYGNGIICRGGGTNTSNGAVPPASLSPVPLTTQNVDIRDGASKTFLAGESVPAWCPWSLWMWFDGSTATCGVPMNSYRFLSSPTNNPMDPSFYSAWQYSYSFMSKHVHGCNFAACDASVHFVSEEIDMNVYKALATIDGGEATVNSASIPITTLPVEMP